MARKAEPSDVELQVLSVLWERGPGTVHHVRDGMPDDKPRAYTTVLSILQSLERKKLVRHKRDGNANIYAAAVKRDHILAPLMKHLLRCVFSGKPSQAMQYLIDDPSVSRNDLDELRSLIDQHEKQNKRKGD